MSGRADLEDMFCVVNNQTKMQLFLSSFPGKAGILDNQLISQHCGFP